ncbi:MAG: DUF4271 domain-containing protein [Bacteroidota bacterium]
MRYLFLLTLLLCLGCSLVAQDRSNPFELTPRLPTEARDGNTATGPQRVYSPFDIRPQGKTALTAPAAAPNAPTAGERASSRGPIVIQSTDPNKGKGSLLAIQLMLLIGLASLWVLYGDLLRQCLRGTVNDNLMTQIYSRRSGGQVSALWLCYCFFFLAAGFYLYLFTVRHDLSLGLNIWGSWLTYSLSVAGLIGLKHIILLFYGRLFPVRKEISRYAFVLMIFSILAGISLVPVNLAISYAPLEWRDTFLYGALFLVVGIYSLHLLRGFFIAGRYLTSRPVHILLYICAIEIAPLLLIYRYLSDTLV